jgi:general stress protein 26
VQHLHAMLEEFPTLLLGTFEQTGDTPALRARPMTVASLDEDCTLYFVTPLETDKVGEAVATGTGHAFGQSRSRYLSLRGEFHISQDRALLEELWSKENDVWFDGPDDPRAAVLILRPIEAELWDVSGANGVKFMFDAAKALLTGAKLPPEKQREQHEKVHLR